jgi:putative addiction module killer protein
MVKIKIYDTFLANIDKKTAKLIDKRLSNVKRGCHGHIKHIDTCNDGKAKYELFEIVIDKGPGYRVYICEKDDKLHCINAGIKKTQSKDILIAKKIVNNL